MLFIWKRLNMVVNAFFEKQYGKKKISPHGQHGVDGELLIYNRPSLLVRLSSLSSRTRKYLQGIHLAIEKHSPSTRFWGFISAWLLKLYFSELKQQCTRAFYPFAICQHTTKRGGSARFVSESLVIFGSIITKPPTIKQ